MHRSVLTAATWAMALSIPFGSHVSAKNGDAALGGQIFSERCAMCHSIKKGHGTIVGPNLFGVVGRPIGKLPGFRFSHALASANGTWNTQALNAFLKDPAVARPGTVMPFTGIKSSAQRAALIRFLKAHR